MNPSKKSQPGQDSSQAPPTHDEYRAGVNPELLGAYWLDTPGGDHPADDCPWCRELADSETGRGAAGDPHPRRRDG
ncbi:hypothetical protein [Streptomyces sp. NPDC048650]|uniref:hypothetical protein n=1 Tax=unclassified Streptomyces TaxID=2593676 RepID=UPI00371EAE02